MPGHAAEFRDDPLSTILAHVRARLAAGDEAVELEVLDPDHGRGRHAGELVALAGEAWRHRPWRVWVDLAGRLGLRLCTPRPAAPPRVRVRLERLADAARERVADPTEKYGAASSFARIAKHEDPDFVLDLADAAARAGLAPTARVLELGCNRGDTLALLADLVPGLATRGELVGVDHSRSAIEHARARFPGANARFLAADLADLESLALGAFDLVLAIDTLQSSGLDDRALLRRLVQHHLAPRGSVVLGLPNCRYRDGEQLHGARMLNYSQPELGLLVKDAAFYRKYLQQHGRTVHVTGHHELLITAVPIGG